MENRRSRKKGINTKVNTNESSPSLTRLTIGLNHQKLLTEGAENQNMRLILTSAYETDHGEEKKIIFKIKTMPQGCDQVFPCYSNPPRKEILETKTSCNSNFQCFSTRDRPTFALFSIALVSTSPETVTNDLGRHSCWTSALAMP